MSDKKREPAVSENENLRDRIAAVLKSQSVLLAYIPSHEREWENHVADAVIAELDMGIPCATTGCRMRQIARRHAESSSRLERPDE